MKLILSLKRCPLNLILILCAALLYLLNNLYFKRAADGILQGFMLGYFNDCICPLVFLAYSNILLITVNKMVSRLWILSTITFAAGLVWEFFAPILKANSVTDMRDIVCYQLGTVVYWGLLQLSEWFYRKKNKADR